ncbi:MAG TPA: nuclear transport factor 2 family protein [Acidimicrobiia bacterium]|nr:nuclear transport factor 2 family protein [Acidimicrobiia bacterium]
MRDHDEIERLLYAYAERLDLGDLDGVAALFEHATWRTAVRTDVLRGREQVRHAYDGVILYDGIPRTKHVITNVAITVGGADVASSRCAFTVLQACPGLALQPVLAGRYHDEFGRVDGTWHFTDRLILPDITGDLSHHMR